jgi:hypothetical protein
MGEGPCVEDFRLVVGPVWARRRVEWMRDEQPLLPRLARRHGVELDADLAQLRSAGGERAARCTWEGRRWTRSAPTASR